MDKLTADDRAKYVDVSHDLLIRIEIPDAVHCTDVNCCDTSHINDTNLFYEQTMRSLIQASDTVFSTPPPPAYKGTITPGWSDYVAELYNAHKDVARLWYNAGKPGNGDLFELRRVSKARYKYALRFIKRNEADMRKESLSSSFPFVRGEVLPATFSPPHLIVFSTLLCLLSSSSSLPPLLPSSHLS